MDMTKWRSWAAGAVVLGALGVGATAHAQTQTQSSTVTVDQPPTMSGTLRVGQTLQVSGGHFYGPSGTKTAWSWLRCDTAAPSNAVNEAQGSQLGSCKVVSSYSASYTLSNDDLNKYVRGVLYAWYGSNQSFQDNWETTAPSAKVAVAATPTPTPTPMTVSPTPTPTPPGAGGHSRPVGDGHTGADVRHRAARSDARPDRRAGAAQHGHAPSHDQPVSDRSHQGPPDDDRRTDHGVLGPRAQGGDGCGQLLGHVPVQALVQDHAQKPSHAADSVPRCP